MTTSASLILAIDAAANLCSAALWEVPVSGTDGRLRGRIEREGPTGEAALLPRMVADLLAETGLAPTALTAIAVNVGPGSFTGLRASIAFAQGLALGLGLPVIAVTMAEALRLAAGIDDEARLVWCALDARQGRLFLHQAGSPADWSVDQLSNPPLPSAPLLITGDAATALGAVLTEAGVAVTVSDETQSHARWVAQAAMLRMTGQWPPLAAVPLYIDPPRALLPRGGLRPPPQGWSVES
ncbi:tRNA (adenosine(37)-N6)-threonylcarbamoyltransferase complex dimerization subunit type 1 TsaB [Acidisoma cellulosilytica]|uniref:tRNA (Adenosine(37)-N6)-threonylcarbamoyltransferase complex dimerization subunit type 1 TsaB n=1 Tax=Acidisoma cellulosilyticum TaxID=2802395 RepID=A0A963YXT6_9PROT|nr:tRNA (adenosine(37)-N6)-threonylcarbamoyltransferase complex dimerization subunit type 1 TsaB [Acidisoma cellulosilyticum]MCB8879163.1 tRNA (adenosine(37)-N6)-threonylcarbamoyltransferase complex dimerization subunit type 1 TsaB [Acidisoma cellulosilyticum]